ncbi:MAG: hypothetical protein JWM83_352 [Candidatus Angelobacter sp.]|nr:hypothetical protein [Candidatus Angelobacter sp.]
MHAQHFPSEGTHLIRYAGKLNSAEINSCFYREHKPETYRKWAAAVSDDFRFAVKMPRQITHAGKLHVQEQANLSGFLKQTEGLGEKRGPVLLQLPPSLVFNKILADTFFKMFRGLYGGPAVLEPRHVSWFAEEAESLLQQFRIARVAADPALTHKAAQPSGWTGLAYFRLHGSPKRYYSTYSEDYLSCLAARLRKMAVSATVWCIFDNTASGAALANALELIAHCR